MHFTCAAVDSRPCFGQTLFFIPCRSVCLFVRLSAFICVYSYGWYVLLLFFRSSLACFADRPGWIVRARGEGVSICFVAFHSLILLSTVCILCICLLFFFFFVCGLISASRFTICMSSELDVYGWWCVCVFVGAQRTSCRTAMCVRCQTMYRYLCVCVCVCARMRMW